MLQLRIAQDRDAEAAEQALREIALLPGGRLGDDYERARTASALVKCIHRDLQQAQEGVLTYVRLGLTPQQQDAFASRDPQDVDDRLLGAAKSFFARNAPQTLGAYGLVRQEDGQHARHAVLSPRLKNGLQMGNLAAAARPLQNAWTATLVLVTPTQPMLLVRSDDETRLAQLGTQAKDHWLVPEQHAELDKLGAYWDADSKAWMLPEAQHHQELQRERMLHLARERGWNVETTTHHILSVSNTARQQLEDLGAAWDKTRDGWLLTAHEHETIGRYASERVAGQPVLLVQGVTPEHHGPLEILGGVRDGNEWLVPVTHRDAIQPVAHEQGWKIGTALAAADTPSRATRWGRVVTAIGRAAGQALVTPIYVPTNDPRPELDTSPWQELTQPVRAALREARR